MMGIEKMVVAAVGMLITLGGPWVLAKFGLDISGMVEPLTQVTLAVLTVFGVYKVANTPA